MQPFFQKNFLSEGKVNIIVLARGNEGIFNGNDIVIFLVSVKRVIRGRKLK